MRLAAQPPPSDFRDDEPEVPTSGGFIEYLAPNGVRWRIELGSLWMEDFLALPDDARGWHEAFAAQDAGWHLLRLIYGVAPLLGETNEVYMNPHSVDAIAAQLALTPAGVRLQVESCRTFWLKWKQSQDGSNFQPKEIAAPVAVGDREALLAQHGFSDVIESDKSYVFARLRDLQNKLEDEVARPIARSAIRSELTMQMYDRMLSDIEKEMRAEGLTAVAKTKYREEFQTVNKSKSAANADYLKIMESMEATHVQNPNQRKKVAFVDCLGQIIRAQQEYEGNGDRALVDGMFTAAEVEIMVRPMSLRPAQYRPDIVAIINDAMQPHNLWNPDYVPPSMDRRTYRRFVAGWKGALDAAAQEQGIEVVDMEEGMEDDEAANDSPVQPGATTPVREHSTFLPPGGGENSGEVLA